MPQTVELPDDLADALSQEASRLGLSLPDYAVRLLMSARPSVAAVHTVPGVHPQATLNHLWVYIDRA